MPQTVRVETRNHSVDQSGYGPPINNLWVCGFDSIIGKHYGKLQKRSMTPFLILQVIKSMCGQI